ncbi:hypothetical protein [Rhodoferax aquaticus]|uniref:Uncharacterized protein n=1 Tax=Rhodoferax aquaticus TaxID=2527691 RepID=A0A515ETY9_9BURK|nr:hypothetical protein [Rhodoferax aquaticus]QDL56147.1 hypothetical protein EXZ61_19380 [Rhodoferax aquaticus]
MKWLKRLAWIFLPIAVFTVYLLWPVVFSKDTNEPLDITLKDGVLERQFRIKRGYFNNWQHRTEEPVDNLLALTVGFPDMGLPPPWKQGEQNRRIMIFIKIVSEEKLTWGERLIQTETEFPNLKNSPGLERFVGQRDGYDVYESQPNPKTGDVKRVLIFKDANGRLVSSANTIGGGNARVLGNLSVEYSSSDIYGLTPREMRDWVENYVRQIVVPPLPPLSPNESTSIKK